MYVLQYITNVYLIRKTTEENITKKNKHKLKLFRKKDEFAIEGKNK